MDVLLTQPVANLGRRGEVVSVTDAYARNFLIPQGLARAATVSLRQSQASTAAKQQKDLAESQAKQQQLHQQLHESTITIPVQANPQGTLFAALKAPAVWAAIKKIYRVTGPMPRLEPDHFKTLGTHAAYLTWPSGQRTSITVVLTHG